MPLIFLNKLPAQGTSYVRGMFEYLNGWQRKFKGDNVGVGFSLFSSNFRPAILNCINP